MKARHISKLLFVFMDIAFIQLTKIGNKNENRSRKEKNSSLEYHFNHLTLSFVTCIIFNHFIMGKINHFLVRETELMRLNGQERTADAYVTTVRELMAFAGREVTFEQLTPEFLKAYEARLTAEGKGMNTISFYMRMLRAIYNRAHKVGIISDYRKELFADVFTGQHQTVKRAAPPLVIRKLINADLRKRGQIFSRDMFLLSFYLRGIPFVDLSYLRKKDLCDNELRYFRRKTGQLMVVDVEPCAMDIIEKYLPCVYHSDRLLPILVRDDKPERKQYASALRLHNKRLNEIGKLLKLDFSLTSYIARHSWASIAKNEGVSLAVISEGMGHRSERTTAIYLASFDKKIMESANQKVIASVYGVSE